MAFPSQKGQKTLFDRVEKTDWSVKDQKTCAALKNSEYPCKNNNYSDSKEIDLSKFSIE